MAALKSAAPKKKRAVRKGAAKKRSTASRKRIPKSMVKRGIEASDSPLAPDDPVLAKTLERIRETGGSVLGAYRDPLSGKALVLASLPVSTIEPTPFQRELSPAHTKRLVQKIEESGAFLDPVIAVASPSGGFWTPNGRHRLAAARALGLHAISALISVDESLAFKILALNTEKAHNLRDRSLEVVRMAREIAARNPRARESDYEAEFEAAPLLTLGILYESAKRFSGGAYHPVLRKVDRFEPTRTLRSSLRQREGWASRLRDIDTRVTKIVKALQERGFRSPYLRAFVVARVNPVRWIRVKRGETDPVMPIGEALTRMARSVKDFNVDKVRQSDLALVAAVAPDDTA